jgi:cytochrome c oxidase cbb3-type subunit 3
MKFRNYLESIAGVGIYPVISLVMFFGFFVALLWYVFRLDKKRVETIEKIPLEDGTNWKGVLTLLGFLIIPAVSQAQDVKSANPGMDLILYVALSLLVAMIGILLVVMSQVIQLYRRLTQPAQAEGSEGAETSSWWMKFVGFGASLQEEKDLILDEHDYDGIKELDNRMPPWLRFTFIGTVVIAVVYIFYYHFSGLGDLQIAELEKEIERAEIQKKVYLEKVGASIDETSVTLLVDETSIKEGSVIYQEKCAACHGQDGGGTVGPNLADEYWLHGGDIKDVFKTIKYGVPEKGMIAWEKQLPPMQIQKVASYIRSLKGTKPASPKEPQGELYVEEVSAN